MKAVRVPNVTKVQYQRAIEALGKERSRRSHGDFLEGEAQSDVVDAYLADREELKQAQGFKNRERQLAALRPTASTSVDEVREPPESWEDDVEFYPGKPDEIVAPFIRSKKHSPTSVLQKTVGVNNRLIGSGEYTLVDVGATDLSDARAAKIANLKYHGISPCVFKGDRPVAEGRGCAHTLEECDCVIPGRKVYLFNHSAYYVSAKGLESIGLGSRVVINEHTLEPGQSVLSGSSKGSWLTRRMGDGEYLTYDSVGALKFQNTSAPPVPNWWLLADVDERPGSKVTTYDVGPKPPPPSKPDIIPEMGCCSLFNVLKSFLLGKAKKLIDEDEEPGHTGKAHQRAQVLLMGVTTGGGFETVKASINRVAKTLAHEERIPVLEAAAIVQEEHKAVMRAQDHMFNVAHKTLERDEYRVFKRLKPWIRVLLIGACVLAIAHAPIGLAGFGLATAFGALAFHQAGYLVEQIVERFLIYRRTSA